MRSRGATAGLLVTHLPPAARQAYRALRRAGQSPNEALLALVESAIAQLQALGDDSTAAANLADLQRASVTELKTLAARTHRLLELLEHERFRNGPQHVH